MHECGRGFFWLIVYPLARRPENIPVRHTFSPVQCRVGAVRESWTERVALGFGKFAPDVKQK